jgi:NOL1/NOP2/fmu family ribosome biogenesis protein
MFSLALITSSGILRGMREEESPRESLKVLNSREKKLVNERIYSQWGCGLDKQLVWLLSSKDRLYVAHPGVGSVGFNRLKVDKVGLYVATVDDKGVRLSIEGSQLIGPAAVKNVVDVSDDALRQWFRGEDIAVETGGCSGPVILRRGRDFVGCGKVTGKGVLNFIPKARRILGGD